MTTVNTNNTAGNAASSQPGNAPSASMSQADFLKLLTTQLQAQDPTNPMDNSQFISQLAQFSQLASTQELNTNLTALGSQIGDAMQTSQVLSSANLVGREVLVPCEAVDYAGSDISAATGVVDAGPVTITIKDGAGNVVRTLDLGTQQPGLARFTWDGKDDRGRTVPEGNYTIAAQAGKDDGDELSTYIAGDITGVGYGGSSVGTYVQVAGVGGVPLSQIAQIN
jgi:flagellar basal-body rod modification protein FlgD